MFTWDRIDFLMQYVMIIIVDLFENMLLFFFI